MTCASHINQNATQSSPHINNSPQKSRNRIRNIWSNMYLRIITIYRSLEESQQYHPHPHCAVVTTQYTVTNHANIKRYQSKRSLFKTLKSNMTGA